MSNYQKSPRHNVSNAMTRNKHDLASLCSVDIDPFPLHTGKHGLRIPSRNINMWCDVCVSVCLCLYLCVAHFCIVNPNVYIVHFWKCVTEYTKHISPQKTPWTLHGDLESVMQNNSLSWRPANPIERDSKHRLGPYHPPPPLTLLPFLGLPPLLHHCSFALRPCRRE